MTMMTEKQYVFRKGSIFRAVMRPQLLFCQVVLLWLLGLQVHTKNPATLPSGWLFRSKMARGQRRAK